MGVRDVELRFIERSVPAPEYGPGVRKMVMVLQMRKLIAEQDRDKGLVSKWTEWTEVPRVYL